LFVKDQVDFLIEVVQGGIGELLKPAVEDLVNHMEGECALLLKVLGESATDVSRVGSQTIDKSRILLMSSRIQEEKHAFFKAQSDETSL
jgi:hypothetical protein